MSQSSDLKWHLINSRKNELLATSVFETFRANNIEPILIKGLAAAQNYPADIPRLFADIDLCVPASCYDKALELISSDPLLDKISIDLHKGFRHLDSLPFETLYKRSRLIDVDTIRIRVLAEEDHLRVLCVHWLNDGGEFRDRLYDIYFAVKNRAKTFDWEICLSEVSAKRRKWIIFTIGLAHKYLALDIEDLPFADEAKRLPNWLTKRIEYEWTKGTKISPLVATTNKYDLFTQLKKRVFANPIQSTIEMEGDLNGRYRHLYQLGNFCKRTILLIKSRSKRNGQGQKAKSIING